MVEEKTVREAAKQQEMLSTAKADMQAVFKAREEKKAKRVAVNRYAPRARRAPPGSRRSRGSERGGPSCAGWAGPSGRSRQAALAASAWQHSELYCAPVVLRLHLVAVYPRDRADAQAWDAAPAAASAAGARAIRTRSLLPHAHPRPDGAPALRPSTLAPLGCPRAARSRRRCSCSATRARRRTGRQFGTRWASSATSRRKPTRPQTPRACARFSCSSSTAKRARSSQAAVRRRARPSALAQRGSAVAAARAITALCSASRSATAPTPHDAVVALFSAKRSLLRAEGRGGAG